MKHADWCAKTARPHDPKLRGYVGRSSTDPGGKLVPPAACTCSSNPTARLLRKLRERGVLNDGIEP